MIKQKTVLVYGDPRLAAKAEHVEEPSTCVDLASHMREVLDEEGGVGLAATQIGDMRRVIVWRTGDAEGVLINPEVELGTETESGLEGCLSVPGMAGEVRRALKLTARGFDATGARTEIRAEGLLARVIQHEVDHLDGILFVDRAEPGTLRPAPMTEVTGI